MNEEAELKIGAKTKILQGEAEPEPEASLGHREQKLLKEIGRRNIGEGEGEGEGEGSEEGEEGAEGAEALVVEVEGFGLRP